MEGTGGAARACISPNRQPGRNLRQEFPDQYDSAAHRCEKLSCRKLRFFTGVGHNFWYHSGVNAGYYLGTITGFWTVITIWLSVAYIIAFRTFVSRRSTVLTRRHSELVVRCAVLQLAFITMFYGAPASWIYYPYLLVMGVATTAELGPRPRIAVWVIAVIALIGNQLFVFNGLKAWRELAPRTDTAGFWETDDEANEWSEVLKFVGEHRMGSATFLARAGAVELMFPVFAKPETYYIAPACSMAAELVRKAAQMSTSTAIVVPANSPLLEWPIFSSVLLHFTRVKGGPHFEVYLASSQQP